ncbi:MAG TPA: hypothetical protein PKA00_18780 [Saprospiraceae bacterium]|nr:hypothetical protein [Saprospiraceae bacterium]HMQ84966.1 hypothetical protein [Saprospiraceae bacterium]
MDSKHDRIKKLLSEETSPLPPELNWEQMEAGILKKMEDMQSDASLKKKRGPIREITAGILILLLIGTCTFIRQQTGKGLLPNRKEVAVIKENTSEQYLLPVPAKTIPLSEKPQPEDCPEETVAFNTAYNENKLLKTNIISNNFKQRATIISTISNWKKPTTTPNKTLVEASENSSKKSTITEPQAWDFAPDIQTLPTRTITCTRESKSIITSNYQNPPSEHNTAPTQSNSAHGQIAILSGFSLWNMGYGALTPERSEFERSIPSYQVQINYTHPLKKGFQLTTGLHLQQLNSLFEWSTELENQTIILQDTIIQVQTNSLTGHQNIVRGDIEVPVEATRNVRHFNQTLLYQIPLAVGKSWRFQHWQMEMLIGGAITIFSENKGRTLYQSQLIDYGGVNTPFMNNQWQMQAMAAGRIGYYFNDRLGIKCGLQFQKSLTDWSLESGVSMRPSVFGGELGVVYFME